LYRIGEQHDIYASLDPKPKKGDWAGSGCHHNVSCSQLREAGGENMFKKLMKQMKKNHKKSIKHFGYGNRNRLTGKNETAHINTFKYNVSDRGASVRIPPQTIQNDWKGYFEDRRPAANIDPYESSLAILKIINRFFNKDRA
jgi:glutamine synthetase